MEEIVNHFNFFIVPFDEKKFMLLKLQPVYKTVKQVKKAILKGSDSKYISQTKY